MANAASTRLDQDTCLTVVSSPKEADAILEVGIALPSVGGDSGGGGTDVFGSQPKAQTLGNAHSNVQKECLRNLQRWQGWNHRLQVVQFAGRRRSGAACLGLDAGYLSQLHGFAGSVGRQHAGSVGSEWARKTCVLERPIARGCRMPGVPGSKSFNPKRDKMSYRQWMQAKCPNVLNYGSGIKARSNTTYD